MKNAIDRVLSQFGEISVVQFIILTLIGVAVATGLELLKLKRTKEKVHLGNVVVVFSFVIYVNIILQLTLLGRSEGSRIGIELTPLRIDLRNKSEYSILAMTYSVSNILLFVPFGALSCLFAWMHKYTVVMRFVISSLLSLGSCLLIELVQLVTARGYYELEDIICNTMGGMIGTMVVLCVEYIVRKISKGTCSQKDVAKN